MRTLWETRVGRRARRHFDEDAAYAYLATLNEPGEVWVNRHDGEGFQPVPSSAALCGDTKDDRRSR